MAGAPDLQSLYRHITGNAIGISYEYQKLLQILHGYQEGTRRPGPGARLDQETRTKRAGHQVTRCIGADMCARGIPGGRPGGGWSDNQGRPGSRPGSSTDRAQTRPLEARRHQVLVPGGLERPITARMERTGPSTESMGGHGGVP